MCWKTAATVFGEYTQHGRAGKDTSNPVKYEMVLHNHELCCILHTFQMSRSTFYTIILNIFFRRYAKWLMIWGGESEEEGSLSGIKILFMNHCNLLIPLILCILCTIAFPITYLGKKDFRIKTQLLQLIINT